MIQYYLPFSFLRRERRLSERELTRASALSRGAVRQLMSPIEANPTMSSIDQLAQLFGRSVDVLLCADEVLSEYSVVAAALAINRDGFDSWKTHLYNFVDEFRRSADARLVALPPPSATDRKIVALFASTVQMLCKEIGISSPQWAIRSYFLESPWFVAGMQSLKASALVESPFPFRLNNIFVHENFLSRA